MKASTIRLGLWAAFTAVAAVCVYQFVIFVFRGGKEARTKVPTAKSIHESLRPPVKTDVAIRRDYDWYKAIADVNLSGVAPKVESKVESRPVETQPAVKIEPLDSVVGVHGIGFDAESPNDSVAFVYWKDDQISREDRRKTILRVGMWCPKPYQDQYRVKAIQSNGIVFEDKKLEEHLITIPKMKVAFSSKSGNSASSATASKPAAGPRADYAPPAETVKKSESEYWISQKDHQEMGEKGLEMIGRDVHAVTYYDSKTKRPAGLRVARMRPDSLPARLGLKESDIVKDVNGAPIRNTADVYEFAKQHPETKEVVISVERFGRTIQITYVLP